jgi:plasmid replication initiation protein
VSNKENIAIKNKILINVSGGNSLVQRKLFNVFLYKIFKDIGNLEKPFFTLKMSDINKLMGYTNKTSTTEFRNDCNGLMHTFISWGLLGDDKDIGTWEDSALLSSVKHDNGQVEIEIPMRLRLKLIENNQYIKLNLAIQKKFSSKYSLIIYELCKEFFREREGSGETRWIKLIDFKQFLGLSQFEYKEFKVFKRDLLSLAVNEINKVSDIIINPEFQKEVRKIVAIKFKIIRNSNYSDNINFTNDKNQLTDNLTQPNPLKISILSLGINEKQINEWLDQYPIEYLQTKYDITIEQLKLGKIKTSPTGFLIRAIEQDFGSKKNNIDDILAQDALEARKLNPETIIVDPFGFHSQEDLLAKLDLLRTQHYNPIVIQSELENAQKLKWIKQPV